MIFRRIAPLLVSCLVLVPVAAWANEEYSALELLGDEAIEKNPSVEAMRDRTRELGELAAISNTWPDPMFSMEYMNAPVDSFSISDVPMGGLQFKLQQRLPEWGWTRAAREVADHSVERSRHARAEAEVRLRRSVETLYWNLSLSRMLEGVTQSHLERTLELIRAVRVRYEVGKAGLNALLRLEVLRDRLRDDLGDFERSERQLSAGLARALARTPESRFETPAVVESIAPEGDTQVWIESAKQHRPELAALREEIKIHNTAAALSRVRVLPEVDVFAAYRVRTIDTPMDDGTDFFSAGVSVPIPWGSRKRGLGGEAASLAASDGASASLAAALDQIEAELIEIDASWTRAAQKATTYKDTLIPAAVAALEISLSDFSVGKAEFSTLYEAEVELLVLERSYLSAKIETHVQRAAARGVTGHRTLGGSS